MGDWGILRDVGDRVGGLGGAYDFFVKRSDFIANGGSAPGGHADKSVRATRVVAFFQGMALPAKAGSSPPAAGRNDIAKKFLPRPRD